MSLGQELGQISSAKYENKAKTELIEQLKWFAQEGVLVVQLSAKKDLTDWLENLGGIEWLSSQHVTVKRTFPEGKLQYSFSW